MRRLVIMVWVWALVGTSAACATTSSGALAGEGSMATAGDFLKRYDRLASRLHALCAKMTPEQLAWRPGSGVRSMAEVLGHLAAAQYRLVAFAGTPVPAGVDPKALETVADKGAALGALKTANAHARAAIARLDDAAMGRPAKVWGRDATVRFAVLLIVAHQAEHLGQAIAYGRVQGVVPPWSR